MDYLNISFGWEVLQTFYVISGYLITRILLNDKNKNPEMGTFLGRFLYRRSFRIFPLYLAFIGFWTLVWLVGNAASIPFLKKLTAEIGLNGGMLYTYTYNFMGFINHFRGEDYLGSPLFAHLWSISLEEQFYLTYPLAVYLLSNKNLKVALVATLIAAPIFRFVGYEWMLSINHDVKWASVNLYRMTPFQMDSFAVGSLLAMTGFKRIKKPVQTTLIFLGVIFAVYVANRWYVRVFEGTSFEAIGGHHNLEQWLTHNYQHVYLFTLVNFGVGMIVMCFERGFPLIPWLFNNKLMAYIGKISYGIYVYHVPILFFWLVFYTKVVPQWVSVKYPFLFELGGWIPFMGLVFLFSHLSYKYFEEFFLKWKVKLDAKKYAAMQDDVPVKK
jgi:peptidoglycan/LPS O-acetylase OafA/YrhL